MAKKSRQLRVGDVFCLPLHVDRNLSHRRSQDGPSGNRIVYSRAGRPAATAYDKFWIVVDTQQRSLEGREPKGWVLTAARFDPEYGPDWQFTLLELVQGPTWGENTVVEPLEVVDHRYVAHRLALAL